MNKLIVATLLLAGSAAISNAASVALVFNESDTPAGTTNISSNDIGNGSGDSALTLSKNTSLYTSLVAYLPKGKLYSNIGAAYSDSWTNTTALAAVAAASGVSVDALKSITSGVSNGQATTKTTYTFNGLTAGETYQFSIIFAEANSTSNTANTSLVISAGTLVSSTYYDLYSSGDTGTTSTSVIGVDTYGSANVVAAVFTATASESGTITIQTENKTAISFLSIATISAVPEPSAFGLLAGLSALAIVASRRRRRSRSA